MNTDQIRTVVITGASSGIGRACALHMDRLGWRVFAGVRRQPDALSLSAEASGRLMPLLLDVTHRLSITTAAKLVADSVGDAGLSGLVNNAGVPYGGPVEFLDLDEVRRLFEVNFFGVIAVTQAFLPLLRLGRGRLVNMSSLSGLIASPFISPYTTSKFALEALSDALRVELHPWNIHVALIEPGPIDTPIWNKSLDIVADLRHRTPQEGLHLYGTAIHNVERGLRPHGIPAGTVARAVAHALTSRHPNTRYPIGLDGKVVSVLRLLPDRLRDWLFLSRLPKWG